MSLLIGVPREVFPNEKRVATVPEVVEKLIKLGFAVTVESGAGNGADFYDDAYAAALDRWLSLGAADLAERTGAVLDDLGLAVDLATPMTALSGGQAARVGLAALLLSRYDILLLDEPTNDLDLDGLDRLERFVVQLRTGMVVVSHDREFLARCVSTVVELDLAQQRAGVYGGGYRPTWPSGSWRASMPVTPIRNSPNSAPSCGSVRAPNAAGRRRDCDAKPAGRAIRTRSATGHGSSTPRNREPRRGRPSVRSSG